MFFGAEQMKSSEDRLDDNLKRAFPIERHPPVSFRILLDRMARLREDEDDRRT
jgi:hypothetical protein